MNLPYQSPSVNRSNRFDNACQQNIDPALFGLSWDDVKGGVSSMLKYLAPHAKSAAQDFAVNAIRGL